MLILVSVASSIGILILYLERNNIPWVADIPISFNHIIMWIEAMGHSSELLIMSLGIVLIAPLLIVLYTGLRLLFGTQVRIPSTYPILFIGWLIAAVAAGVILGRMAHEMQQHASEKIKTGVIQADSTGTISVQTAGLSTIPYQKLDNSHSLYLDDYFTIPVAFNDSVIYGLTEIECYPGSDTLYEIYSYYRATGKNTMEAKSSVQRLSPPLEIKKNTLVISSLFSVNSPYPWRNQSVIIKLYIPKGQSVIFPSELKNNIHYPFIRSKGDKPIHIENRANSLVVN